MYTQAPVSNANLSAFAPFADNFAASKAAPAPESMDAANALAGYQAPEVDPCGSIRSKRDTTDIVIERMASTVGEIIMSDRLRGELDKVVDTVKRMDVREIEVKAYNPVFKEPAKARGDAVKQYLIMKGIDANLIEVSPKGPGYGNKDSALAKEKGVRIEIYGSPKADAQPRPAKRSIEYLMA
ncbi:hypothetical protein [Bordetella bronchialis]|uniref:OmpA-like domain-containing protein n=1 Tax=Bordetella bronchialis TaxID=463025 RepID=A0ABN4R4S8_9BORD|nr:hypothetical protein [Bordetella bronchialis]ANN68129.1 hypothetical protein BAU06_19140 [Bordetella bronchialis]